MTNTAPSGATATVTWCMARASAAGARGFAYDLGVDADDNETYFLAQLDKLADLATDPRPIAAVDSSGVLRRLLLDKRTVLSQADKRHRVKPDVPSRAGR